MVDLSVPDIFRHDMNGAIDLILVTEKSFRVSTPFQFDDGDNLSIILKQENDGWVLSDEGHTYFHLTYDLDEDELQKEPRKSVIAKTLKAFQLMDREGELVLKLSKDQYTRDLYSFIHALLRIIDVKFLSREQIRTAFRSEFKALLEGLSKPEHRTFQWYDPKLDPDQSYPVDCRINGNGKPFFIFALKNDYQTSVATITLHQFEKWQVGFKGIGIFENQQMIGRKVLARFTDICDRQFPNITSARKRLPKVVA